MSRCILKKRITILISILMTMIFLVIPQRTAQASADDPAGQELEALCLPGMQPGQQVGCYLAGPSLILDDLAQIGITFPPTPIPVKTIPASLGDVPYRYAKLTSNSVPSYRQVPSIPGEAPTRYVNGHIMYISYQGTKESEAGLFFLSESGYWFDGGNIARATPPVFQGVEVTFEPRFGFGWILGDATAQTEPGHGIPVVGKTYHRFDFVPVYETRDVDQADWTRIGPNEWIEKRLIARVLPNPTPPEGVENGRWIEINLYDQTVSVYDDSRLVFATLTSTGSYPYFTQPGVFQIYQIDEHTNMSGSFTADRSDYYYFEDVPWTLYYDKARAIHGAYWQSYLGYKTTHGCVNLSLADAHWVYDWVTMGDWVYIWDESGKTPTDPAYYTQGGA